MKIYKLKIIIKYLVHGYGHKDAEFQETAKKRGKKERKTAVLVYLRRKFNGKIGF